jgi:hypothetical protein
MAKFTQIQVWSKDRDEHGFPKKYNAYVVGPTTRIGDAFFSPILRVRDNDLRIAAPANRIKAPSEEEARALSIEHFRLEAEKQGLDFILTEMPEV